MGRLVEGQWLNEWYDTSKTGGRFERHASHFRNWVTPDGAADELSCGYLLFEEPDAHGHKLLVRLHAIEAAADHNFNG